MRNHCPTLPGWRQIIYICRPRASCYNRRLWDYEYCTTEFTSLQYHSERVCYWVSEVTGNTRRLSADLERFGYKSVYSEGRRHIGSSGDAPMQTINYTCPKCHGMECDTSMLGNIFDLFTN